MLILQRRVGESLLIGDDIEITVVSIDRNRVRIAITAPNEVPILRSELVQTQAANKDAAIEQSAPEEFLHMLDIILPNDDEATKQAHTVIKPVINPGLQHDNTDKNLEKG